MVDKCDNFFKKITRADFEQYRWANKDVISQKICEIRDKNLEITQEDFDRFVNFATFGKSKSYLLIYYHNNTIMEKKRKAIEIMFSKFTPNSKQITKLLDCYKCAVVNTKQVINPSWTIYKKEISYDWLDVLSNRGVSFDYNTIEKILAIGYDIAKLCSNITFTNYKDMEPYLILMIGGVLDDIINFNSFVSFITDNNFDYPEHFLNIILQNAKKYPQERLGKILRIFADVIIPNQETNDILVDPNFVLFLETYYQLFEYGFIPNEKMHLFFSKHKQTHELVFILTKYGHKMTTELMNNMLESSLYFSVEKGPMLLDQLGFSLKGINTATINKKFCVHTLFLCESIGILPNYETLKICIRYNNLEILDVLLNKYNLIPDKNVLDCALANCDEIIINKILCHKVVPDDISFDFVLQNQYLSSNLIIMLVKFGLHLTKEKVGKLLLRNKVIDDLDLYGIEYNGDLYFLCYVANIFPNTYITKFTIDPKILGLRDLCKDHRSSKIKFNNYMKTNNVKPDRYCLEFCCRYNKELAQYLMKELRCDLSINTFYFLNYTENNEYETNMLNSLNEHCIDDAYMSKIII